MIQKRNGKILDSTDLKTEDSHLVKGKLFYTIGIARGGKSTFASRWVRGLEEPELEGPRCIVCRDDFRLGLSGQRFNSHTETMINALAKYAIEALLLKSHVLIDETNTREESIKQILEIDIDAQYYFISTDVGTCIQRAKDCGQLDLINPIYRMHNNIQKLLTEKGGLDNTIDRIRYQLSERQHKIVA